MAATPEETRRQDGRAVSLGNISLRERDARRLNRRMAEHIAGRARRQRSSEPTESLSAAEIASLLVPRRDRLVEQLPRELAVARGLTTDQSELVVDESIDFVVTQLDRPLQDEEAVDRAFWAAAAIRSRRMHDGRHATVRAGWRRVGLDGHDVPTLDSEPEAAALEHSEVEAMLEFASTLSIRERQVLGFRYGVTGRPPGAITIARWLGVPLGEVRSAERSLHHKFSRFIAVMAAGSLCTHREPLLESLALGELSDESERIARLHLDHCPACKLEHAARLRGLRIGKLPRDVAGLLPAPPIVETNRQARAVWDATIDWAGRPFTHEATATGMQLSAAGRGIGSLAAAKLVAVCIGGASLVGGGVYCVSTIGPHDRKPRQETTVRRTPTPTPEKARTADDRAHLRVRTTPTPAARPRRRRPVATPRATPTPAPAAHERAAAISPPPAGSAPNGASEFGPGPAQSATQPAPPASGGGPEFP
jgi:hypothetical protein